MEDNIRRIVSETQRLCRERDIKVDNHVIAYMACLQDVRKGIEAVAPGASILARMEPHQVASVAQMLVKQLSDKDSPLLAATKMQAMMEVAFKAQREAVEREQAERDERVAMLARAVAGARPPRDSAAMAAHERIYSTLLEYVAVAGGLELALNDEVAREEVRAALDSVFPLSSLVRFLTLGEQERVAQVEELARITVGICLFNRAMGRGGYALPPGGGSYVPQASRLLRDMERTATELAGEVAGCAALQRRAAPRPAADGSGRLEDDPGNAATRERAQAEALHKAVALLAAEGLAADLRAGLEAVGALEAELDHMVVQAQATVGGATAVPKEAVMPLFDRLGAIHSALGDELRLLVVRQRLFDELTGLAGGYVTLLQRGAKARRPGRKTPAEEELGNMAAAEAGWAEGQAPPVVADGAQYVGPSSLAGSPAALALSGFDPVVLVRQGQLRRAVSKLGGVRVGADTYGFAHPDSVAAFAADPAGAVAAVDGVVTRQPGLARLLGRATAFPALDVGRVLGALGAPLKVDFGCQTPTHFVEKNIDHSYEWNEWVLRRRALSLANLRQKATHGTQTGLSHFKRDAEAQVWQPKAAAVQTRVNKGQAMPKKLQYVAGLRGAPDTKMKVVRLELDLGQPHQH